MAKEPYEMTLAELVALQAKVAGYIALGVSEARTNGRTWASIAEDLGVSPQEAHRRYRYHQPRSMDVPSEAPE
jgi:hypothetical protein